ncbi:UNVERIFIED_CONTAM: hypothetical protein FKN15_053122 [Acipenser sinensis]
MLEVPGCAGLESKGDALPTARILQHPIPPNVSSRRSTNAETDNAPDFVLASRFLCENMQEKEQEEMRFFSFFLSSTQNAQKEDGLVGMNSHVAQYVLWSWSERAAAARRRASPFTAGSRLAGASVSETPHSSDVFRRTVREISTLQAPSGDQTLLQIPTPKSLRVQFYRASLSTHLPMPSAIQEHERHEACETTVGFIQPLCCMHHNTTQGQELDVIPLVPVASA